MLSGLALGLFAAQILAGVANVISRLKPWAIVTHVALSVLIWASLVALATVARRFSALALKAGAPRTEHEPDAAAAGGSARDTITA